MSNRLSKGAMGRVDGLDITRGLAVFGMMFMNFKIAFRGGDFTSSYSFVTSLEGRFGVIFIFMAGLGVSLMNRKALFQNDRSELKKNRIRLAKRALFLFVLGMLFSLYWFADILHFYAFYLLIGIALLRVRVSVLKALLPLPVIIFSLWNIFFSWEKGWNFIQFSYPDFYSLEGFFRNLFFNGFHPIFPWISFFILGMILGKTELRPHKRMLRNMWIALGIFLTTELLSFGLNRAFPDEMMRSLTSTRSFPPFPLFVISASAMSVFILYEVILLIRRMPKDHFLYRGFRETGKMVMSHYVGHLFLGIMALYGMSSFMELHQWVILVFSIAYFILSIALTLLWRRKFPHGPLEMLMRKISR